MLLAAGLALAFTTLRAATATAARGETIAQRNEHMRAVELFLRRRIGGARPVQFGLNQDTGMPRRFEGDATHMRFVADLPDYLGRGGPYLHELTLVDGEDGQRLEVDLHPRARGRNESRDAAARARNRSQARCAKRRFRYRAMKADNTIGDWQDQWTAGDRLPLQVEVTLQDADGRTWPPMVVTLPLAAGYAGSAL